VVVKSTRKVWVNFELPTKFCSEYETGIANSKARGIAHGDNIELGVRVSIRYIVRFLNMVMNIQFL